MLDRHLVGIDTEIVPEPSLGPDGDVAQAHGPVALVEQGLRHDPHRVGEVDQPRAGVGPGRHLLGQAEDDRHRPQRLGQPAGADGLLAQAPVADGKRLVDVAGRLAADAQLHDDEVGALEGGVRVGRRREGPAPSTRAQDALGEPTDDVAPHVARVEQDEVVDDHPVLQIAQAVDELGGVGAPAADDGHLCPHAAQRNIRACPSSPPPSRPCSRSTAAARRPMSSSCPRDGAVLGRARVGPSNHQLVGLDGMLAALAEAVDRGDRRRRTCPDARPVCPTGVYCLAGIDLPVDEEKLAPAIDAKGWTEQVDPAQRHVRRLAGGHDVAVGHRCRLRHGDELRRGWARREGRPVPGSRRALG